MLDTSAVIAAFYNDTHGLPNEKRANLSAA